MLLQKSQTHFILLLFFGLATAFLNAQTTRIVDGIAAQTDPNSCYATITEAVNDSSAGDTILIRGMLKSGGGFLSYDESSGEDFPISIDGLTLVADANSPIVFLTQSVISEPFFKIEGSPNTSSPPPTVVEGLYLIGGTDACSLDLASGETTALELKKLKFFRNHTALRVNVSDGAQTGFESGTYLRLTDCMLVESDSVQTFFPTVLKEEPTYGVNATIGRSGTGDAGRLLIEADNFRTVGAFSTIATGATLFNLFVSESQDNREHASWSTTNQLARRIANLVLDLSGCSLDGFADPSNQANGWANGIIGGMDYSGDLVPDYSYNAALEVRMTGTDLLNFRQKGINIFADSYCRAHVILAGYSSVEGIGRQRLPNTTPNFFSLVESEGCGVFLDSAEGYISLHTRNSSISNNLGHGVYAHSGALPWHDSGVPWGVYFDMQDSRVHYNGADGIYMKSSGQSIVGGAYYLDATDSRVLGSHGTVIGREFGQTADIMGGQGRINRCSISNNGSPPGYVGRGIVLDLKGQSTVNSAPINAVAITNSIIWNHAGEGVLYDFSGNYSSETYPGWIVSPIIHCTLVGNGGSPSQAMSGQTTRSVDVLNAGSFSSFEWLDTKYFRTKVLQSILYGANTNDLVFGEGIVGNGLAKADSNPGQTGNSTWLYMAGLRTSNSDYYGEPTWASHIGWWTDATPPFTGMPGSGAMDLASKDPSQFYLQSGSGATDPFGKTPFFIGPFSAPVDLDFDIQPIARPVLNPNHTPFNFSDRDKGAHHEG